MFVFKCMFNFFVFALVLSERQPTAMKEIGIR